MGTYNIYLYKEVDKYTGCNLKSTDCLTARFLSFFRNVLTSEEGVCAVIRSNTVICIRELKPSKDSFLIGLSGLDGRVSAFRSDQGLWV